MRNPPMPLRIPGRHRAGASWLRVQPFPEFNAEARRFTRRFLTGADPDFVDDAEVVTSELVTNALNHSLSTDTPPEHVLPGIWLGVEVRSRYVHLRVRDPYPVVPLKRVAADTDTSGRGLEITEALTAALWVDPRTYDKTMHAILVQPGVVLTETEIGRLRTARRVP